MIKKRNKKTDNELHSLVVSSIRNGHYIFLRHANERLRDRHISDIDILDILEGKKVEINAETR